MPNGNIKIVKNVLRDNGFIECSSSKAVWTLWWHIGPIKNDVYPTLQHFQKINHHPKMIEITKKDKLNQNISKMVIKHGKPFDFVPKTYLLPQELSLLIRVNFPLTIGRRTKEASTEVLHSQTKWLIARQRDLCIGQPPIRSLQ